MSECDLSLCYFKDPGGTSDKESACKHVKGERERERERDSLLIHDLIYIKLLEYCLQNSPLYRSTVFILITISPKSLI